ncbi:MAG TPA: hypothetical protein VH561_13890 [Micromonosporaceae bacterium]
MNLTDNQARLRDALRSVGADGASAAALADTTGLGYSTVTRLLRELDELAAASRDATTGLWHATGHPSPASADTGGDDTATRADATGDGDGPSPTPAPDSEPAVRMRKGALRDLVLAALRDAAGQPLGPTELSHRLGGRSQGAIANACDALVATGHAVLTSERPRRFAATT